MNLHVMSKPTGAICNLDCREGQRVVNMLQTNGTLLDELTTVARDVDQPFEPTSEQVTPRRDRHHG